MKYCSKCGIRLDDNASFCIECGGAAAGVADNPTPDYSSVPLISQQGGFAGAIREFAKSNIFLAATIIYTVAAVLNLISSVINAFALDRIADEELLGVYGSSGDIGSLMGVLLGMVPTILVVVGLWMTYLSAKSNSERMSTSGLGIIRVISIIMLVLVSIAVGLLLIVGALMLIVVQYEEFTDFGYYEFSPEYFSVVLAVVIFVVVAIAALAIIYYALAAKTIKSVKMAVETDKMTGKISIFVAVMAIVFGAITALASFALIKDNPLSFLSLPSAAVNILFGIILFKLDSKLAVIAEQK